MGQHDMCKHASPVSPVGGYAAYEGCATLTDIVIIEQKFYLCQIRNG
jgi:hypothetical protein